jgi:hypothetical protein
MAQRHAACRGPLPVRLRAPACQGLPHCLRANPESCDYADIVLFRCTGPLSASEARSLERHRQRTGQRFVLTCRTYSDWDAGSETEAFRESVKLYAGQAAALGDGFGFYSFNEMVDTHLAYSPAMSANEQHGWSPERAERAIGLVEAMVGQYRRQVAAPPVRP